MFRKFILIFFISFNVFSTELILKDNTGGLNSKASPLFLKNNESSDLQNIDLDTDGALNKRKGYSLYNSTVLSENADSLYYYTKNNSDAWMITCAGNIYKTDSFDGTWDDITGTTAITADTRASIVTFDDTVIISNGVDKVQEWDGTGTCSDNDVYADIVLSKAKYLAVYQNKLVFANVTVDGTYYPDRVYFSDTQDKDGHSGVYITIGFDDGDEITGVIVLGSYLYALKKNSIYRIRGTGEITVPYTFDKTSATEGCIAPYSIQTANNMIIYLSDKGLTVFDGTSSKVISTRIKPTLDNLDGDLKIDASSVIFKELNQYWLSISDGGEDDRIVIWDYHHNAFLLHEGIHGRALLSLIDSDNNERLYFSDFNGYVYRSNQGYNDNPSGVETAVNAYYYTKHFYLNTLITKKEAIFLAIIYKYSPINSILNLGYSYDFSTSDYVTEIISLQSRNNPIWDIAKWDVDKWGGEGASYHRVDIKGAGIAIRFKISNKNLNETFSIYGWSLGYDIGEFIDN